MSTSKKAYSAPMLESLDVRATRDIDINAGLSALGASVSVAVGLSS